MLTGRSRLMRALKGEEIDRVPISLYEFDGFYDKWIYNHKEYVEILEYAKGKTDKMYFWAPQSVEPVLFYGMIEREYISRESWRNGKSVYTRVTIETPRGSVSRIIRQDDDVHTSWIVKHFCESLEDASKILSIPYKPWRPNVDSFFRLDEKLGDEGILLGDIADALCLTVGLFGFSRFLKLYMRNREMIFDLMDYFHERVYNYLEHLLKSGAVTIYRICGPEYATPPFLNPREFDKLVTSYDSELVDLLHRYGGYARLHSHGRVKRVLPYMREMNIDAIDPLEPPPDGDVELREARKLLGSEVVLMGNIEERLFEMGSKRDIERSVKKAIKEGASGGGFILCPTAMPITTPLRREIQQNIIHYIDCGLKYGRLKDIE
ncbi:hypothetical protein CW705_03175 [Candidatus Bathyarchaeota archaeon]|nr:MAG: hypothetical protein CW705_03175 [Candidatus Bathyarchaeota archaeon]